MGRLDKTFKPKLNEGINWEKFNKLVSNEPSGWEKDFEFREKHKSEIDAKDKKHIDILSKFKTFSVFEKELNNKKYLFGYPDENGNFTVADFVAWRGGDYDNKDVYLGYSKEDAENIQPIFEADLNEQSSGNNKSFTINLFDEEDEVHFEFDNYSNNGALAVELVTTDGESYGMLSVNLPDSQILSKDEFFLKDWSENEDLARELIKMGVLIPTGKQSSGKFIMAKSYKVSPEYANGIKEGWGKNLAAGAMMGAASMMPMNVQAQQNTGVDNNKTEITKDKDANRFQKRYQSYEIAMKEYAQFKKENPNYDSNKKIYGELMQWKKQLENERNKTYKFGGAPQVNEANYDPDPNYTHYAVLKSNNKIINGWDYNGYDSEELRLDKKHYFFNDIADMDIDTKQVAIYTKRTLEKRGINPSDWNYWAKSDEMPFVGM